VGELDLERHSHIVELGLCQQLASDHGRRVAQVGQCIIINKLVT
jgi:hypothetical protein